MENVVKYQVFMTDRSEFAKMNEAYGKFFPADKGPPARTTVVVAGLVGGNAKVEIECIAVMPKNLNLRSALGRPRGPRQPRPARLPFASRSPPARLPLTSRSPPAGHERAITVTLAFPPPPPLPPRRPA